MEHNLSRPVDDGFRAVVFLDIDGVICTRKGAGWTMNGKPMMRSHLRLPVRAIDPVAMQHLNKICEMTGASVVVSSMWRIDREVPQILLSRGFSGRIHKDWRTDADGPLRSDEIARWLDAHDWPAHIVIDDKDGELISFKNSLVLTNNYYGLRVNDVW